MRYVPAEENAPVDYASAIRQWNIGSEDSAQDNAFMFSVIQSCQLNERDPKDYLRYLLQKLRKSKEGEDLTPLLPCCCCV